MKSVRHFNIQLLNIAFIFSVCTAHNTALADFKTKVLGSIILLQQVHIQHPEVTREYIDAIKKLANEIYDANIKKEHVDSPKKQIKLYEDTTPKKHINPNVYEEGTINPESNKDDQNKPAMSDSNAEKKD